MANLFWKTKRATTSLLATPFKTEEEFEKLIFDTPQILEDIFLLKRQIRGGGKSEIPDRFVSILLRLPATIRC